MAFDGGDQCCLFTTHECTCAESQFQIEAEIGAENVLAQQSVFLCLIYGYLESFHSDGILGSDIDISLVRSDGIARYGHCLDYAVGISLQYTSVHECARVTFVSIAAYVFFVPFGLHRQFPLQAGGETSAASASEAGLFDLIDHLFRCHLSQCLCQRPVPVICYIFVDILRIDDAAVSQCYPDLTLEEVDTVQ